MADIASPYPDAWVAVNRFGLEADKGYRTFELFLGDITAPLRYDENEVLVVSAFRGNYHPTPGTVIQALHARGLDVESLLDGAAVDLRESSGTWIALHAGGPGFPSCWIAGVELRDMFSRDATHELDLRLRGLFATFQYWEAATLRDRPYRVTLPLLGAGKQGLDPKDVLDRLLPYAKYALVRSPWMERIRFVAFQQADAEVLSEALDNHLGRHHSQLDRFQLLDDICKDIDNLIRTSGLQEQMLLDLLQVLNGARIQTYQLGPLARITAEWVTRRLLESSGRKPGFELFKSIEELRALHVAPWMISYLHTLRVFGNMSVHDQDTRHTPESIEPQDVVLMLYCLQRVLAFSFGAESRLAHG